MIVYEHLYTYPCYLGFRSALYRHSSYGLYSLFALGAVLLGLFFFYKTFCTRQWFMYSDHTNTDMTLSDVRYEGRLN